jgi:hypothetical protein
MSNEKRAGKAEKAKSLNEFYNMVRFHYSIMISLLTGNKDLQR